MPSYSSYDDSTTPYNAPLNAPTWPTPTPPAPPTRAQAAAPRRARFGCGALLGLVGAFALGVIVTALVFSAFFLATPAPAAPSSTGSAALKITVTDALLTDELNANSDGALAQPKIHIGSDGNITVSGVLQGTPVGAGQTAVVVLAPRVAQSKINVTAISGSVAGFPVPAAALAPIGSQITSALAQSSSVPLSNSQSLTVTGISFADGQMTIAYA